MWSSCLLGGYNERCSASACSGLGGHDMLWRSVWPVSSVSTACHVDGRGQNEAGRAQDTPAATHGSALGGLQEPSPGASGSGFDYRWAAFSYSPPNVGTVQVNSG